MSVANLLILKRVSSSEEHGSSHCIVFPAMLKAEGNYILPDNVPSNEFLNLEGDKISTSRNWAVWLLSLIHI